MKVNISGVGLIPKIGLLAPQYGRDLDKDTVSVILNFSSFRVFVAATGVRITKTNIDEVFGTPAPVAPTPKKKTTKKTTKKAAPVEEVAVAEPVKVEPVVEPEPEVVVEAPAPVEEPAEEVVDLDVVNESEEVVEETSEDGETAVVSKKNKKKRR